MICTAPCFPSCTRQATFKLLNMKSRARELQEYES